MFVMPSALFLACIIAFFVGFFLSILPKFYKRVWEERITLAILFVVFLIVFALAVIQADCTNHDCMVESIVFTFLALFSSMIILIFQKELMPKVTEASAFLHNLVLLTAIIVLVPDSQIKGIALTISAIATLASAATIISNKNTSSWVKTTLYFWNILVLFFIGTYLVIAGGFLDIFNQVPESIYSIGNYFLSGFVLSYLAVYATILLKLLPNKSNRPSEIIAFIRSTKDNFSDEQSGKRMVLPTALFIITAVIFFVFPVFDKSAYIGLLLFITPILAGLGIAGNNLA